MDAGAPTPAGTAEHYLASSLLIIGGLARLLAAAFGCAVLAACNPRDAAYRATFAELHAFCAARGLPSAMARRLRLFFRHTAHLEAATRHDLLLSRLSPRLRAIALAASARRRGERRESSRSWRVAASRWAV